MKKYISSIVCLFCVIYAYSEDLFTETYDIDNNDNSRIKISCPDAKFIRVTDQGIDTVPINRLITQRGTTLICISENWCPPSYKEFNRLYNEGIIDLLKGHDVRLIILSMNYPFIHISRLDECARNNIEADFEIYYSLNNMVPAFPNLWLIGPRYNLIFHSEGVKDNYEQLRESFERYISSGSNGICRRCNGLGMVRPNRCGSHECVDICTFCGGKG